MRINFAHLRERSTTGGFIDFAVFEARSTVGTAEANAAVLGRLTLKARRAGLKVDKSALAYREDGRVRFFGDEDLVTFLSRRGVPQWTHSLND